MSTTAPLSTPLLVARLLAVVPAFLGLRAVVAGVGLLLGDGWGLVVGLPLLGVGLLTLGLVGVVVRRRGDAAALAAAALVVLYLVVLRVS